MTTVLPRTMTSSALSPGVCFCHVCYALWGAVGNGPGQVLYELAESGGELGSWGTPPPLAP